MSNNPEENNTQQETPMSPQPAVPTALPGLDLSTLFSTLQNSAEQVRQMQQDTQRREEQHQDELNALRAEIDRLLVRGDAQDERILKFREQTQALLADYRSDLDAEVHRADVARRQMLDVDELIHQLEDAEASGDGRSDSARRFRTSATSLLERRGRQSPQDDGPQQPEQSSASSDQTVQINTTERSPQQLVITVHNVNNVATTIAVRRAIEELQSLNNLESRFTNDGSMIFTAQTQQDCHSIANTLTRLKDLSLKTRRVTDNEIELDVQIRR